MKNTMKRAPGTGCLILFALPFAGVGVFMVGLTARTISKSVTARSWDQTPCRIESVEARSSSEGNASETKATYTYDFGGRSYTGSRVSVHGGGDNIGSFQQRVRRELEEHRRKDEPFTCYVDPDNPAESVLYPKVRLEMIAFYLVFGVIFGGVGFGLIFGALWAGRKVQRAESRKLQMPDEPWRWREDWANGEARSSNKGGAMGILLFAVFWNLISVPIAVMVLLQETIRGGDRAALFVLIFPAVGLLLAGWAIRKVVQWRKFGTSTFVMASVPGVAGGRLAGVITVPVHILPEDGFHVTVRCIRKTVSGSGKNRHTTERVLWEDEQTMKREIFPRDPTRSAVPVLFGIPYDASDTDPSNSDNQVLWRLEVTAAVPGVDYDASFEVPVFHTADSSPDFVLDDSSVRDFLAKRDPDADLRRAGVVFTQRGAHAAEFYFPPARFPGAGVVSIVFAAVWVGGVVLMLKFHAPIGFPIVFGLFGILIVWGAIDFLLAANRVTVTRDGVRIHGGLLALGKETIIGEDAIANIKTGGSTQSGSQSYYTIKLERTDGKPVTLAKYIRGKREAETVIEAIRDAIARTV